MAMHYKLFKDANIIVSDIDGYMTNDYIKTHPWPQMDRGGSADKIPTQYMCDKYAKNKSYSVVSYAIDYANKQLKYRVMINANKANDVVASYEDICKSFRWKSFEFSEDHMYVFPKAA